VSFGVGHSLIIRRVAGEFVSIHRRRAAGRSIRFHARREERFLAAVWNFGDADRNSVILLELWISV
jgi:hypothetical protein